MSLYTDLLEAGQPVSNWQSDLYCPVNDVTRALLKKHNITTATTFIANTTLKNKVEGDLWYDVPFMFDPFWDRV